MSASVLVSLTELKSFIRISDADSDDLLQSLVDGVEEQFLADCNRRERPFSAAQSGRIERANGTGHELLALHYPIDSVSSINFGFDLANPDQSITPTDTNVVVWERGTRNLVRVDGGTWGPLGAPLYITVEYDCLADLPELPKIAIKRAVATIYRQMGAEDATRERLSSYERDLRQVYANDAIWKYAVRAHWEPRI